MVSVEIIVSMVPVSGVCSLFVLAAAAAAAAAAAVLAQAAAAVIWVLILLLIYAPFGGRMLLLLLTPDQTRAATLLHDTLMPRTIWRERIMGGKGSFWAGRKGSWRGGGDVHFLSGLGIDVPLALVVMMMMVMLSITFGRSFINFVGWGLLLGMRRLNFLLHQTFPPLRRWTLLPCLFLFLPASTCVKRMIIHPSAFRRSSTAVAAAFYDPIQEKVLKLGPGVVSLAQTLQPLDKLGCVHLET